MCPILPESWTWGKRGQISAPILGSPAAAPGVPSPLRCGGAARSGARAFPEQLLPSAGEGKTPGSRRGIAAGALAQLRRRIGC